MAEERFVFRGATPHTVSVTLNDGDEYDLTVPGELRNADGTLLGTFYSKGKAVNRWPVQPLQTIRAEIPTQEKNE